MSPKREFRSTDDISLREGHEPKQVWHSFSDNRLRREGVDHAQILANLRSFSLDVPQGNESYESHFVPVLRRKHGRPRKTEATPKDPAVRTVLTRAIAALSAPINE